MAQPHGKQILLWSAVTALSVAYANSAVAGEWLFIPRTTISEEYTDNVTLVDQGSLSDFITTITPGISIRGTGARLTMNVDYNLQRFIYADNSDFNQTSNQLQSNLNAEIMQDSVFFNAASSLSQRNGNSRGRRARDNRSRTGNNTDVLNYNFGPTVRHRFGNWADFTSSYEIGGSFNDGQQTGSTGSGDDRTLSLVLSSGRRLSRMPISFSYSETKTEYDSGISDEIKQFTTSISYVINRKFRINTEAGFDDNSFGRRNNNDRGDGFRWNVGGTFTPSSRTNVTGSWGERGFGETFNVVANHTHRRLNFNLSYTEEIRTAAQRQRDVSLIPLTDIAGVPVFDINQSSNILVPFDTASINEEVSLSKRLQIQARYRLRRSSISANYFQSDRTFQSSLINETTEGVQVNWNRTITSRLTARFLFSWDSSFNQDETGDNIFRYSPSINYLLGPHTNLNVAYQYVDSKDTRGGNSYLENALTANLTVNY